MFRKPKRDSEHEKTLRLKLTAKFNVSNELILAVGEQEVDHLVFGDAERVAIEKLGPLLTLFTVLRNLKDRYPIMDLLCNKDKSFKIGIKLPTDPADPPKYVEVLSGPIKHDKIIQAVIPVFNAILHSVSVLYTNSISQFPRALVTESSLRC